MWACITKKKNYLVQLKLKLHININSNNLIIGKHQKFSFPFSCFFNYFYYFNEFQVLIVVVFIS